MKNTPLFSVHQKLGARFVDFGGWNMPVQYRPILEEVSTVRGKAGLFDLSHMGRVWIQGKDTIPFLQRIATNRADNMKEGQVRYSLLCDEKGNCIDDILMYRESDLSYFLVINAGNTPKDLEWMQTHSRDFEVKLQNRTDELAMIAIQGPASEKIVSTLCTLPLASLRYYFFCAGEVAGIPAAFVSRTGYTGEDGFEIFVPSAKAETLWNALMKAGESHGMTPIGLGARDTLRLEAGMPLYGHEIDENTDPLSAGLGWAVKFAEGKNFIGKEALETLQARGLKWELAGFTTESPRVPRQGYPLVKNNQEVGRICSGSPSPTVGKHIATGFIPAGTGKTESKDFSMKIRDSLHPLTVVSLPFYQRKK